MTELIKEVLEEYFSELKKYHLIILVLFTVIVALIQIIQSIVVTKKIERFKTELKKTEIKFSRYNELQINALRNIYHKLFSFQISSSLILRSKPNSVGYKKYKSRIRNWIKSYIECASELSREKILLPEELKTLYKKTLKDFDEVKNILLKEEETLDYFEGFNWNEMSDYEDEELDTISTLMEQLKSNNTLKNSDEHIKELRNKIETTFTEMNQNVW